MLNAEYLWGFCVPKKPAPSAKINWTLICIIYGISGPAVSRPQKVFCAFLKVNAGAALSQANTSSKSAALHDYYNIWKALIVNVNIQLLYIDLWRLLCNPCQSRISLCAFLVRSGTPRRFCRSAQGAKHLSIFADAICRGILRQRKTLQGSRMHSLFTKRGKGDIIDEALRSFLCEEGA